MPRKFSGSIFGRFSIEETEAQIHQEVEIVSLALSAASPPFQA